ncbi:MAG: SAM-dependent methyltransferase [Halobacteriota archaeon]|nr:SAM-dependent methyltransferase [Halobacteriota archaeon]
MKATDTGVGVSSTRAMMMLFPKEKHLFEDPYSEKVLTPYYKFWFILMRSTKIFNSLIKSMEKRSPGALGWFFCRTRYIDDVLRDCISNKEIKTVVNLGAGMDCRAYYIPGLEGISYFEIDHPSVIDKKKKIVKKILNELPDHVSFIPIDFDSQSLSTALDENGYDPASKTLFIWEGVTQYISKEANDDTLKYVAQAAPGSEIVFTYVLKSFISGEYVHDAVKTLYKRVCKASNPLFIYGLDPTGIRDHLERYSLSLIEEVGSEEFENRYIRSVDLDLQIKPFDIERFVLAEVKDPSKK